MERPFKIVIFSSMPPPDLQRFLRRLALDLPEIEVAGVLYELNPKRLPLAKRGRRFVSLIKERDFQLYTAHRIAAQLRSKTLSFLDLPLRLAHAAPAHPNGAPVSLDKLAQDCAAAGISFHVTADLHDLESLAFVRALRPDLGVLYGTRILKPELFRLPARGSINIHKHKLPDYRGSGAPGIWEMRDGKTEVTVSVHRVEQSVDAGAVLGERAFSIDPYDTLESVGLKADLLGLDLLIDALRAESEGRSVDVPQPAPGTVYKGFKPHQIFAIERAIKARRTAYEPASMRPPYKLLARSLAYPALSLRNRQRQRQKKFPVVILYHHVITDKPKSMGMPTAEFARHVRYLKRHYRIAALPEALRELTKGEVPEPTVVLTFDDGYAENFLCLRAVAEAENVPVAHFICTQRVTEQAEFDHDLEINEPGFPAFSWEQVRYLERHGVTIGSHTRNHLDCGSTDEAALTSEIAGAREDLMRELGHDVEFFAFPKGHKHNMSEPALRLARQNYPYIFSAFGGVNYGPLAPPCELYRCSHPETLWELELLMQSVLEFN